MKLNNINIEKQNQLLFSFPNSVKTYEKGLIHDINVPHREIYFDTDNKIKKSVTVYDSSGPYTDPNIKINLENGLPKHRLKTIFARGHCQPATQELKKINKPFDLQEHKTNHKK